MKYVIIGAGIAGTTAAETLRDIDSHSEIYLITEEEYPLYSRIAIASYASGTASKENIMLKKEEYFRSKNITFLPNSKVFEVDKSKKLVKYNSDNTTHELIYDKLLLATGAVNNRLNVPGSNGNGIFYLRNISDAEKLLNYAKGKKTALIVGGVFIGVDFVKVFLEFGVKITFLIRDSRIMSATFDEAADKIITDIIKSKGVEVRKMEEVEEFILDENNNLKSVRTNKGNIIDTDLVGVGVGICRVNDLVKAMGLKYNIGLITDDYLRTSEEDIYAAGDITECPYPIVNEYIASGDWFSARLQGICAAKNMAGVVTPYDIVPVNIVNLFGTNIQFIGIIDPKETDQVYEKVDGEIYKKIFTRNDVVLGGIIIGDNGYANRLKLAIQEKRIIKSIDI